MLRKFSSSFDSFSRLSNDEKKIFDFKASNPQRLLSTTAVNLFYHSFFLSPHRMVNPLKLITNITEKYKTRIVTICNFGTPPLMIRESMSVWQKTNVAAHDAIAPSKY